MGQKVEAGTRQAGRGRSHRCRDQVYVHVETSTRYFVVSIMLTDLEGVWE